MEPRKEGTLSFQPFISREDPPRELFHSFILEHYDGTNETLIVPFTAEEFAVLEEAHNIAQNPFLIKMNASGSGPEREFLLRFQPPWGHQLKSRQSVFRRIEGDRKNDFEGILQQINYYLRVPSQIDEKTLVVFQEVTNLLSKFVQKGPKGSFLDRFRKLVQR